MKTIEIFDAFAKFGTSVQFFAPKDPTAYFDRQPCKGFGLVRYDEGSVYVGELYFDGKNYNKLGFGRQEFLLSLFGNLNQRKLRRAFYIGNFDYRETGWIYGNGVMYYVDNDNKPACFVKGFFSELHKIAEYDGVFAYDSLAAGFTPDMEADFDEWYDILFDMLSESENLSELENLFIDRKSVV